MEFLIVSRMKRETPLAYSVVPRASSTPSTSAGATTWTRGEPLIGVCPEDQLTVIQDVVARIQSEWEEEA